MMAPAKFCRRHRRRRPKSNPNHQIDIFSGVYLMNDCCALCTGPRAVSGVLGLLKDLAWCSLLGSCANQGAAGGRESGGKGNMLSLCDRNKPEGNE